MRKLYATMPRSNAVVEREVARVSRILGVEPPKMKFWSHGIAKYEPDERTIYIHDTEWAEYVDPDCTGPCFWGAVVWHEFAHYLADIWTGDHGHTPEMYAIATALALLTDIPLDEFYRHEKKYKPLAFKRGRKMAGAVTLIAFKKGMVVTE
jgi:hypothetical protein